MNLELSVVMPCLNEADTLESCIRAAQRVLNEQAIQGEIIIADNGSTDGSLHIAERLGVRTVLITERGYGSALRGGIAAARGKYVIMADADASYDFGDIPKFVAKLREGYDLVQGCRFPSGGGRLLPKAMPWLHRWWGNPMFSLIARKWFGAPVRDVYCGYRGFVRALIDQLRLRCTGMEFATEMIIKSSLYGAKIGEVPITLHPDGRKSHAPHLKTFRDGWRTMRFFMIYSPRWLFFLPGGILILFGLIGYGLAMPGLSIGGATLDAHTLLFASVAIICGYQSILFALFTKTYAVSEGLLPEDKRLTRLLDIAGLERGALLGLIVMLCGMMLLARAVLKWHAVDFGHLDYSSTMRWVIPGATLTAVGFQSVLSSFFLNILRMRSL